MAETFFLGVLFFGLQSVLSAAWLRSHSQGPLEYVWKKISYSLARAKRSGKEVVVKGKEIPVHYSER